MRVALEIICWTVAAMLDWTDDARSIPQVNRSRASEKKAVAAKLTRNDLTAVSRRDRITFTGP
jgi:hypothetical protein